MGMYDTIFIDKKILKANMMVCPKCGAIPVSFQTKDLNNLMDCYYLKLVDGSTMRLFKLDDPTDKKFWHHFTPEEKEENKKNKSAWFADLYAHDGYWEDEAWLPENRHQRDMGELPHQWLTVFDLCKHSGVYVEIEYRIKFTDGCVETIEKVEKK